MSLEAQLTELTQAIHALTAAVTTRSDETAPAPAPDKPAPKRRARKKATPDAAPETKSEAPETDGNVASLDAKRQATPKAPTVTIEDVRGVVIDVVNTLGRESGSELLGKFKAAKVGDVDVDDYDRLCSAARTMLTEAAS